MPTNSIAAAPAESASYDRSTFYRLLSQPGTDASGASRAAQSLIVLPQAQREIKLGLNDSGVADEKSRQLAAAADRTGKTLNESRFPMA